MMPQQIKFFETLIQSIDLINGRMSFKGQYADETKELTISALIPFIARDIFLAQKDKKLMPKTVEIKIMSGRWPHIAIVFMKKVNDENFKMIKENLIKILWSYNYLSYDARKDKYQQRFTYSFLSKLPENHTQAVA